MCADGGQAVLPAERTVVESVEQCEPGGRTVGHRDGDGPIEGDYRIRGDVVQNGVQL